jgi:tetratricopeptide (TPR) repeat protein
MGMDLQAAVSIREEKLNIPTWEIGPPAIHPLFPGPQGPIYPYTLNETLTDNKVNKEYNAVFLENEFIRVLVLPEIGGRIHGALDKSNNYRWLYWQPTIKPGLISMTGAWISGGIEWNFPHGHRPSGFMTVDHRIVKHEDGSATVWVGETEPIYRMRWLVGITVYPGRSYVRCDYVFINPTNHKNPFQFWATASTHANEWTQAQYPGDMVTGHGKHEFWNWPINNGVDLTWWKNVPNASSFFAFNNPSDWFGAYDHKAQGGTVHVADHQVMPGKKLWTWGSGPSGRIWEDILTEGGGAYYEPQAGAWSDNQPDYHWMDPQQVRATHDYWYPVRDTRGYHKADKDFAVNTDLRNGLAFGAVYSTGIVEDYRVVLKNAKINRILKEAVTTISPDRPFTTEVRVDGNVTFYDLYLAVYDKAGKLCIDLQQQPPRKVELPAGLKDPGDPKKMNQDALYHSGEWLDKYVRHEEGLPYFQEALKRDPKDSRVNSEMGFLVLKQGRWEEALKFLNIAQERDSDNSRLFFGKGLAYAGLRKFKEAYDQFYRATYTYDYFSAAYFNLAKLDMQRGDFMAALEKAAEAESQNGKFADIPALKAAAFRHLGENVKALAAAEKALELDPMHFMGGYEKSLALKNLEKPTADWDTTWTQIMRNSTQNYLELAVAYADAGLYPDATAILGRLLTSAGAEDNLSPMVHYLEGYYMELMGNKEAAAKCYARAAQGPVIYTNPHRLEELAALEAVLRQNPSDAHAHLFWGNLLYALGRQEDGASHWKKAVELNPLLSLGWRNVGYAENQLNNNFLAAHSAYQKVLQLDPKDSRALLEMDQVAERSKMPAAGRLEFLEKHRETVNLRDDLVMRWVDLRLEAGKKEDLEAAYQALKSRHFHVWEGGYGIHLAWMEVNQELGDLAFTQKDYSTALNYYQQACEYPKNLEVAPRTPDLRAHVNWNLAKVYLALGQPAKASGYLKSILAEKYEKPQLGTYYQALAEKALNNTPAYHALLNNLEKTAQSYTSGKFEYRGRTEAIGYYLLSLVLEEKGDKPGAVEARKRAMDLESQAPRLALTQAQIEYAGAHQ